MWSSGPISQGQFSGNAWREQVITRQPAAEKRFTVAWPMPRLAPVSRSARRGWLSCVIDIGGPNRFYGRQLNNGSNQRQAIKDRVGSCSTVAQERGGGIQR